MQSKNNFKIPILTHVRAGPGGPDRSGSRIADFARGSRVAGPGLEPPRDPAISGEVGPAPPRSPHMTSPTRAAARRPATAVTCCASAAALAPPATARVWLAAGWAAAAAAAAMAAA